MRPHRRYVRSAAVTVAVVAGLVLVAAPAIADPTAGTSTSSKVTPTPTDPDTDPAGEGDTHHFVLDVRGTTVPAGVSAKTAFVSIHNLGPNNTFDVSPSFDLSGLDSSKVSFELAADSHCVKVSDTRKNCGTIGERDTIETTFRLVPKKGATPGPAGKITVTVYDSIEGDVPSATKTVDVAIGGNGPDLFVWAPDQPRKADGTAGRMPRGSTGNLSIVAGNQGDETITGVRLTVRLLRKASFPGRPDGCRISADRLVLTCDYPDLSLIPSGADTDPADNNWSAVEFTPAVHIATDAASPKGYSDLPFNVASVEALPKLTARLAAPAPLPVGVHGVSRAGLDVGSDDNTDDFTILVTAADDGSGGDGGQGDGGTGGGLPVTGPRIAVLGVVGSTVLLAGVLLVLGMRRRRIIPVLPRD